MIALTSQPCADGPPWQRDPGALVLVDWSSWTHKAWALADVDMLPMLVGWLCGMLAYQPAHLALALDSPGATFRHRMQHPTDEGWRYKGDRPRKPEAFFALSAKATEIVEMHAIPCLWADGFEADDVIATACAQARAAGYRVWIATGDKDLHQLVDSDPRSGLVVGTWDRSEGGSWRGPLEVRAKWGVEPSQLADLLAIMGDTSDNIPGVDGLGCVRVAAILQRYVTLEAALAAPVWDQVKLEEQGAKIKALEKLVRKGDVAAAKERAELMARRAGERDRVKLVAAADVARFARDLTALDCDAPVDVPWEQISLGGYDVAALRERYTRIGYVAKALQVETFEKPAPWAIPWSGEEAPSAPRRNDGDEARAGTGGLGQGPGEHHLGRGRHGGSPAQSGREEGADARGDRGASLAPARDGASAGEPPQEESAEPVSEAEEDARDLDAGICRARIRGATALGRQYIREDLGKGQKYNLRATDLAELLVMLDAYDRPARRRGAA